MTMKLKPHPEYKNSGVVTSEIDARNITVPDLPLDDTIIETDSAEMESGEEAKDAVVSMEPEY